MLSEILEGIGNFLQLLLSMLGLRPEIDSLEEGKLRVFIKHQNAVKGILPVDLDPTWSIAQVKVLIAPKLHLEPEQVKIIFAGKELPDDLVIQDCNVGQHSFLHAVQVLVKSSALPLPLPSQGNISPIPFFQNEIRQSPNHEEERRDTKNFQSPDETNSSSVSAVTNSNFYVYCTVCHGLHEGKLRVRCGTCGSGAFIVLRDPESWEDVKKPNQVPGSCATDGCTSTYSQFYFKCASHVTSGEDDTCPPLPQVKRNPEAVPCLGCGDAMDPMFVFDCSHTTCVPCFEQYALSRLNERRFVQDPDIGYSVGCPALCTDSLIHDPHHFRLIGKDQYDRYQRFGAEEFVLQSGGILCPQPECGMGIIPVEANCNKIACVHGCGFVFCRRCLEGWHMGDCRSDPGCSESVPGSAYPPIAADMAARAQWEDATRRTIKTVTKPCPKCRVATQRDGGCMHMECPKCSFHWCWICQVQWNRECMGNHWFE